MTRKKGGGRRDLAVRVKTARGRRASSTRWLERQLNDPYVARARAEGLRSRAAFKLVEIDNKYRILKPGMRVADLGAAPGGWSEIAARRVDAVSGKGRVIAVDLLPIDPIPGVDILTGDFLDAAAERDLRGRVEGQADVVLSDMAAATTGHRSTDHLRTTALFEAALDFAEAVLAPGGTFLGKVFRGGAEAALLNRMKRNFQTVRHVKPDASRKESVELYVLATGFRGVGAPDDES